MVLNMAQSVQCHKNEWFFTPWVIKHGVSKHMAYMKSQNAIPCKDGDSKVVFEALDAISTAKIELDNSTFNNYDELEGDFEGKKVKYLNVLEGKTCQVVAQMVDSMEL